MNRGPPQAQNDDPTSCRAAAVVFALATVLLAACAGGGGSSAGPPPPPPPPTAIILSQSQPVSGSVTISINGGSTYTSVDYLIDFQEVGKSTQGPGYAIVYDTTSLAPGQHVFIAHVQTSPGVYVDLRLTVEVVAPEMTLQVVGNSSSVPGILEILINATAASGITRVSAALNGTVVGTLTAPNCSAPGSPVPCSEFNYIFTVASGSYPTGNYTITVQAVDGNGKTGSASTTVTIDNPNLGAPVVMLTSPANGALVYGTLHIAGTFASAAAGATVKLLVCFGQMVQGCGYGSGAFTIYTTSASPFATDYSLAGLPPGLYVVYVKATDNSGRTAVVAADVYVTSSAALVYPIGFHLPGSYTSFWDADDGSYAWGSGSFCTAPSAFKPLAPPPAAYVSSGATTISLDLSAPAVNSQWGHVGFNCFVGVALSDGYFFVQGYVDNGSAFDPFSPPNHLYDWTPDGARSDLSAASGTHLVGAHGPWVLSEEGVPANATCPPVSPMIFGIAYNAVTKETDTITLSGNLFPGQFTNDFYLSPTGTPLEYFDAYDCTTGGSNVFVWDQSTGTVTAVTTDNMSYRPTSDGTFLAWANSYAPGIPSTLHVRNLVSNTDQTPATTAQSFWVGGIIAWTENSAGGISLLANDGTKTSLLSTQPADSNPYLDTLVGGGKVVFSEKNAVYSWSPQNGRHLLFDVQPNQKFMKGGTLYARFNQAVYVIQPQ